MYHSGASSEFLLYVAVRVSFHLAQRALLFGEAHFPSVCQGSSESLLWARLGLSFKPARV